MKFKTLEEAKRWLKHLETLFNKLAKVYLGKKYCPIELCIGNLSYTDHRKIQVSITEEEALTMTKGELMRVLTLKVYHECGHCKYTDRSEYEQTVRNIADLWSKAAVKAGFKPHLSGLMNLANGLLNAIEDGRMENQVVKDVPGVQKHRVWYRLRTWLDYSSLEEQVGDLYETLNNILEIATAGMYCKDFEAAYPIGTKIRTIVDSCIEPIALFVTSPTIAKGASHALAIADNIKELILDAMAKEPPSNGGEGPQIIKLPPELEDMLRAMLESERNFSNSDTEEVEDEGPIIGILTDEESEGQEGEEGKEPDILIDLRKNPPQPTPPRLTESEDEEEGEGEGNDSSTSSEGEGSSSEADNGEGQGNSSKESESSEDGEDAEDGQDSSSGSSGTEPEGEAEGVEEDKSSSGTSGAESEDEEAKSGQDNSSESIGEESEDEVESAEENEGSSGTSDTESEDEENESGSDADSEADEGNDDYLNCPKEEAKLDGETKSVQSDSTDSSDSDETDEVDQESLQAGAKDFEASIKERLEKALAEANAEVSSRVAQVDRALEAADKVEEGSTELSREDIDMLHELGYLEDYYDKVPSCNILEAIEADLVPATPITVNRGRQIEQEIRNIIASQSEPDRDNLFDGDLDEMAIGRFVTFGQSDIFCQEGDPKEPDLCVYVRQDNSGSMSGSNFHLACEAGALIEQAFKNLVPLKMTYFTDDEFDVIKDWDDRDSKSYMETFRHYYSAGGGNDDALAIMSAALELTKRPESHKLLIVISDGAPCCSVEAVAEAVRWARKNGIFVVSFFIGDKNFIERSWELYKQMYEKYFCGVAPDKLGSVLVRFIRTMIESA